MYFRIDRRAHNIILLNAQQYNPKLCKVLLSVKLLYFDTKYKQNALKTKVPESSLSARFVCQNKNFATIRYYFNNLTRIRLINQ